MKRLLILFLAITLIASCSSVRNLKDKTVAYAQRAKSSMKLPEVSRTKPFLEYIDEEDTKHLYMALNYTEPNKLYGWYNRKSQITFRVYPQLRYYPDSHEITAEPCRLYFAEVQHGSFEKSFTQRACRNRDRTWDLNKTTRN